MKSLTRASLVLILAILSFGSLYADSPHSPNRICFLALTRTATALLVPSDASRIGDNSERFQFSDLYKLNGQVQREELPGTNGVQVVVRDEMRDGLGKFREIEGQPGHIALVDIQGNRRSLRIVDNSDPSDPVLEFDITAAEPLAITPDHLPSDTQIREFDWNPPLTNDELLGWMTDQQLTHNPTFLSAVEVEDREQIRERGIAANRHLFERSLHSQDWTLEDLRIVNGLVFVDKFGMSGYARYFDPTTEEGKGKTGIFSLLRGETHSSDRLKQPDRPLNANREATARMLTDNAGFGLWPYPVAASEVNTKLQELLDRMNALDESNSLLDVARLFSELHFIHASMDANSKTSFVFLDNMLIKIGMFPLPAHKIETRQVKFLSPKEIEIHFREAFASVMP